MARKKAAGGRAAAPEAAAEVPEPGLAAGRPRRAAREKPPAQEDRPTSPTRRSTARAARRPGASCPARRRRCDALPARCRQLSRRGHARLPVPPVRRRLHGAVGPWQQVLPKQCRSERNAWCATRLTSWQGFGEAARPESHRTAGASPSRPCWATTRFPTESTTRRRYARPACAFDHRWAFNDRRWA